MQITQINMHKHRHIHREIYYLYYTLLSVTTTLGLQVPKSTVCLSCWNIPKFSENWIFSPCYLHKQNDREEKLAPCYNFQTQQWAIIRFVSTFCSWCIIRVTSRTLENTRKRDLPNHSFFCVWRGISEGEYLLVSLKSSQMWQRLNGFSKIPSVSKSYCLWLAFLS